MNHVLKNYGKSLYKIKNDTQTVALEARKLLDKDVIAELVKTVQSAIYANTQDVDSLKADIRNSLYHVFGNHVACKPYLCSNVGDTTNERSTNLTKSGLHHHIHGAMNQLLTNLKKMLTAHLLADKETNNRAELFMSLLARFNMGKRLNLIQRDSFQLRSNLTGLKYNEGHMWHTNPWKKLFEVSPGRNLKKWMNSQEKRVQKKRANPYKKERILIKKRSVQKSSNLRKMIIVIMDQIYLKCL